MTKRIDADHWENGEKLSRSHLPSIFPWSKPKQERRKIVKASQEEIEKHSKKRKRSSYPEPVVVQVIEPTETPQMQTVAEVSTQTDFECFCLLKNENEKLKEEISLVEKQNEMFKIELQKVRSELNCVRSELTKEKQKQAKFDIEKYKSKDSDVEFYTGVPTYKMLTFCFILLEESLNVNGFGFASHWLQNWRQIFKPMTKHINRNRVITFDNHLKTAVISVFQ